MNAVQPTVTLVEPPQIPEQYQETIRAFVAGLWRHYRWQMQEQFGFHNLTHTIDPDRALITDTLAEIARCAAGQVEEEDALGIVAEGIQGLMELLFAAPVGTYSYQIPESFWETDIGQMVAVAMLKVRGDELITIAEAGRLRGVSTQAITNLVAAGRLRAYHDPGAPARQGRRLVSRAEIEALD